MKFDGILFPTDFSAHAAHAQRFAVSLAREYDTDLHILHVAQLFSYVVDFGVDNTGQYEAVLKTLNGMMDALLADLAAEPIGVVGEVVQGDPVKEIVGIARREESGLIVVGTHGRSALEHVMLGSTSERVVRKAPCPVLTVPFPGHRFTTL